VGGDVKLARWCRLETSCKNTLHASKYLQRARSRMGQLDLVDLLLEEEVGSANAADSATR
jgi:hypothetical protein